MTPEQAELPKNQGQVYHNLNFVPKAMNFERLARKWPKPFRFKVGQVVRIMKDQLHFKAYEGAFTNVLYQIKKREYKSFIPVYHLAELLSGDLVSGVFYEAELQAMNLAKNSNLPKIKTVHSIRYDPGMREQVQVTYEGDPKNRKSWVYYDDLIPIGTA